MASTIDFAIAVGLFFTFIAVLIGFLLNYIVNFTNLSSSSELRTVAYNIYLSLFADKGIPRNWTESGESPLKVGLITDMYRIPVVVSENSSTDRGDVTLNISLRIDGNCENRAWNNTVRVINASNLAVPVRLFNQTFCSQQYLQTLDIVFSNSFNAAEDRNFTIYFSNDKNVTSSNGTLAFPSPVNFTFIIYPEEKLSVVSPERLRALRNLNYSEVGDTLSKDYNFRLEISE